ncbi:hypothetical protein [Desertihabitans aurantiacus]|uniref:hypothetical protein n=1 Tax=Desertihabitans aurantiacus TaxID=2282477 RepID=UPI0013007493|nr:hypothetical protein [Desertihabitans aurantiacus]
MLVPLRTLPGWPSVEEPTVLMALFVMVGLPLVALLIIFVLGMVPRLIARGRGETAPEIDHPLSIWGVSTPEEYHQLSAGVDDRRAIER